MKYLLISCLLISSIANAQTLAELQREEKALKHQVKVLKEQEKREKLVQNIAKLRLQLATLQEKDK